MWWVDIEVPNDSVDMSSWESSACYPRRTFYPLSDGPSTQNHRITMTDFRLCLTCLSCSQACFCHYTLTIGFRPIWAHHRAPPLLFRRRPPQSNYPPYNVLFPDKWDLVRYKNIQEWYLKDDSITASAATSKSPTYPAREYLYTIVKL